MDILRIAYKLPPYSGGMENHILRLSEEQRRMGHKVVIYFSQGNKTAKTDCRIIKRKFLQYAKPQALKYFIFYINIIFHLIIKRQKFEVIHIHGDWSSFIWASIIKKLTGARKVALTNHGFVEKDSLRYLLQKITLKKSFLKLYTGNESYELFSDNENTFCQPSGVNVIFKPLNSPNKQWIYDCLSINVMRPEKNILTILEIAKAMPTLKFAIVGKGPVYDDIKKIVDDEHLTNISLLGLKKSNEIVDIMSQSKLFLHTALKEGTPTVLMEAICMGLPFVCSDVASIKKLFPHNINGYYVSNPYNASEYVDYINKLLCDVSLYERVCKENLQCSDRLKWPIVAKRITEMYND